MKRSLVIILALGLIINPTVLAADFGLFGNPATPTPTSTSAPVYGTPPYSSPTYGSPSGGGGGGGGGGGYGTPSGGGSPDRANGLTATYFDNDNFTNAVATVIDPYINFNWGFRAPHGEMGVDSFSVIWSGEIVPPVSGRFTFYAATDDGVRLYINDQPIINNWRVKSAYESRGTINLVGGQSYRIRMEYFERKNRALASLRWSATSRTSQTINIVGGRKITRAREVIVVRKQIIPPDVFYP